jgi:hypothetical protein
MVMAEPSLVQVKSDTGEATVTVAVSEFTPAGLAALLTLTQYEVVLVNAGVVKLGELVPTGVEVSPLLP